MTAFQSSTPQTDSTLRQLAVQINSNLDKEKTCHLQNISPVPQRTNTTVEWLATLIRIQNACGLNLSPKTGCSDRLSAVVRIPSRQMKGLYLKFDAVRSGAWNMCLHVQMFLFSGIIIDVIRKAVPQQAMKAWGSRHTAPAILILGTSEWSASRHGRFTPREKVSLPPHSVPTELEAGWAPQPVWSL